jgi:3-oxoacyl-[acyl-carrier protein] reductase
LARLQDRVAIVTGASRGIGKVIARQLAIEGALVIVSTGRSFEAGEALAAEINSNLGKAIFIPCDVTKSEEVSRLVSSSLEKFDRIDILVNNAGITRDTLIVRMKDEDWDDVLRTNLKGAFNCSRAVARIMMKQRSGRIINVSSVVGLMGNPGQANYAASKAGLFGLTKSMAKEMAPRGITVNAIAPGYIETEMTQDLSEKSKETYLSYIPMHQFGRCEDVAAVAVFLASDEARYLTGEIIRVDGGLGM